MSTTTSLLRILLLSSALLTGCASAPRIRSETSQRVPDSAPDKVAAQRAAAGLHLEEEDERWGFTNARELKRRREQKAQQPSGPALPGPVDLEQTADAGVP